MGKKTEKTEIKKTLKLEGNLSIYEASTLKEKLAGILTDADILEIDISEVMECDTSGLQILCSAKRTADRESKKIGLSLIPKTVQDAMIRTGITHEMIAHIGGTGCQR
jgi:anti-sigma B factor antagonist